MSFFGNVLSGIGELSEKTFDHYGKIDLMTNPDACFFLTNLDNFSDSLTGKNNFTKIYDNNSHAQLEYTATIGLSLKKTNRNSIGDHINPEFINALKKSSLIYMNILANTDWIESTAKIKRLILSSLRKPNNPDVKCVEKMFANMGNVFCVLSQIKKVREDIDIEIQGTVSDEIYLVGKEQNIENFRLALKDEVSLIQEKAWELCSQFP